MIMSRVYINRICGINIENSIASKSKGLNATIGVFFDGTGNNLYNIGSITNRGVRHLNCVIGFISLGA